MRYLKITFALTVLVLHTGFGQTNKTTFTISGKVTQTSSYCGGAAPSPEMLEELARPVIYAGRKFSIRKGSINTLKEPVILSFKSDNKGLFSFQLPPGIYSVILEEQVKELNTAAYQKQNISADAACLKAWWKKPYYILEVKDKDINTLNFSFHHPCFIPFDIPCLQYTGPYPP